MVRAGPLQVQPCASHLCSHAWKIPVAVHALCFSSQPERQRQDFKKDAVCDLQGMLQTKLLLWAADPESQQE